jgi:hypothetical protein
LRLSILCQNPRGGNLAQLDSSPRVTSR